MPRDRFFHSFRPAIPSRAAAALTAVLAAGCALAPNPNPPRTLAGNFDYVTPEGWRGRRFTDNRFVLAEEYDTTGNGRLDLWRYYDQGRLVAEERDLSGTGQTHYVASWVPADGRLLSAARDVRGRGVFDTQIEYIARNRWRVAEDRNGDGFADRVLTFEGPSDFFRALGVDLATCPSVIDAIPAVHWRELRADPNYTGTLAPSILYRNGEPYERVLAYKPDGRPDRIERIRAGTDPDAPLPPSEAAQAAAGDRAETAPSPAAPEELRSWAAADIERRRSTRPIPPGESTAGAVPRNMHFRAPGQL